MSFTMASKITVFGDSIGKGIATDTGIPKVLDINAVGLFEREYGVKVDNRSAFGQSLSRLIKRDGLKRYLSSINKNDDNIAIIELGGNDADFNWVEVSNDPFAFHDANTPIDEFSNYYGQAISSLKQSGVRVIACTIVPICSDRYFNNVISRSADKNKVLEFFNGDPNIIHRRQEMFNNEILKNSYGSGVEVIDLRRNFLHSDNFCDLMCQDGIHPNEKGQFEIYNAIKKYIARA